MSLERELRNAAAAVNDDVAGVEVPPFRPPLEGRRRTTLALVAVAAIALIAIGLWSLPRSDEPELATSTPPLELFPGDTSRPHRFDVSINGIPQGTAEISVIDDGDELELVADITAALSRSMELARSRFADPGDRTFVPMAAFLASGPDERDLPCRDEPPLTFDHRSAQDAGVAVVICGDRRSELMLSTAVTTVADTTRITINGTDRDTPLELVLDVDEDRGLIRAELNRSVRWERIDDLDPGGKP